ncbi:transporter suffix domain-containing protein [Ramlibacter sp. PS3R-8]|uniref:transporter suffix domain-containing protein n=1 Tax=Ramlibacter sp. PS3R-8 TaxID=3133437 RepID=UPI003094A7F5
MSERTFQEQPPVSGDWKTKTALVLLIVAMLSPLLVPVVLAMDLPREVRGPLAGLMLFGLPMAMMLIVVGLVGQPAFAFIKRRVGRQDSPPAAVGLTRYRIGVVLVFIALLLSWTEPLLSPRFPTIADLRVPLGAFADAVVLIGLFVLGGEFWDKLHALFVHDARVTPDPSKGTLHAEPVLVGWRFYVGVAMLMCTVLSWGLIPLASNAGWSTGKIASLTGGIFIANKVLLIGAVAVMGKSGFNYLKQLVFGALRRFGPPRQVSRGRYRLGLVLFMVPMLMTWIAPYITGAPGSVYGFLQELALEALVLVGLFLLGGDFWDKVRALFQHRARVQVAGRSSASPAWVA